MATQHSDETARVRITGMLEYVEQLIRLDENVARKLEQHRLADGTQFALHQHELHELPGLQLDLSDEEGPIWLRIERLTRSRPPAPPEEALDWITVSNDPEKPCATKDTVRKRVTAAEKENLIQLGIAFDNEFEPSLKNEADGDGKVKHFDLAMTLVRRPELVTKIEIYRAEAWETWAALERPRRRSIAVYQRLFEIAQLLQAGHLDQSELVCGVGVSRWRQSIAELELPIIVRGVEIQINESKKAEIAIRPRAQAAQVELRAFQALAPGHFNTAEDAARRSLKTIESVEADGVSPFRAETFEPILKLCSSQLDPEGRYLPEHGDLVASKAVPTPEGEHLIVSDRFVFFARRRGMNVVLSDIERLKEKLSDDSEQVKITGAARTLALGPGDGISGDFVPLGAIGSLPAQPFSEPEFEDDGDLFFPKPFNDDQVAIIRRLERSDGLVVQGPPGTGKTHTIANIISHMLAKGKKVLVISHGESALSVVREQLPAKLRDLTISVTTSERDGERQVERAVSLMLEIVNDFSSNHINPQRRIATIERSIIQDQKTLKETDVEIAKIANIHFSKAAGEDCTPFELAQRLMGEQDNHAWFSDRPELTVIESGLRKEIVETGLSARREVGDDLRYLNVELARSASLPARSTLEDWRADLRRAKEIDATSSHRNPTRRIISKIALAGAEELLSELEHLLSMWRQIQLADWSHRIFNLAMHGDANFSTIESKLTVFVQRAAELGHRYEDFLTRGVSVPDNLPAAEDLKLILDQLTEGKNPFGLLAFRLKKYQPAFQVMTINNRTPSTPEDWKHISSYLALKNDTEDFFEQWHRLCVALQAPTQKLEFEIASSGALSSVLEAALALPKKLLEAHRKIVALVEDETELVGLIDSPEQFERFAKALSAKISQTRLIAVRDRLDDTIARIPDNGVDLNRSLRELLRALDTDIDETNFFDFWDQIISELDRLQLLQGRFDAVNYAVEELNSHDAFKMASQLMLPLKKEGDLIGPSWLDAWNWWARHNYLVRIGARDELSRLNSIRLDAESRLRANFAELVRERAFYALAGSMPGTAKSALKAFADLLRKLGKGTGKRAPMHRRELRSAMLKCYNAVPCWIMPAWRVSEQLPSELGSFDLVILDEASQSDAKELPALLRGKKILVVGDDRQVSPTDAFIKQDDIERLQMNYLQDFPFPTHLLPGSSIYELARVMFPDKFVMLKEHFRCVEPIIRFSMQFYDEPLIPLRVPTANERLDPPLVDIFVEDGYRQKGKKINSREAEVIVDEIEKFVGDPAQSHVRGSEERPRSIGVISLIGGEQARLVQQMIIERIGEQKFIEHRILCGDSATMQGNERDIVFLSMVAGPQSRIGAQTAEQYRRRFNVALSRARDRMILVRSIDESHLNPLDLKARVIQHFRNPMPANLRPNAELIELCQSGFEREIFTRLTKVGYVVIPQVGSLGYSIDLVVEGSNGRRLAVECDGDLYHGPDRWAADMRRQRILERVGWIFWRVFGSTYSLDPNGVFDDLIATLERMGINPSESTASPTRWSEHRTIAARSVVTSEELDRDLHHFTESAINIESAMPDSIPLSLGDRVVVRFIDKPDSKPIYFMLTNEQTDQRSGLLNIQSPLAQRLSEIDVGEEFSFEADGNEQRILFVAKQSEHPMEAPQSHAITNDLIG
jgi:very-short-patch-repair endonuclease